MSIVCRVAGHPVLSMYHSNIPYFIFHRVYLVFATERTRLLSSDFWVELLIIFWNTEHASLANLHSFYRFNVTFYFYFAHLFDHYVSFIFRFSYHFWVLNFKTTLTVFIMTSWATKSITHVLISTSIGSFLAVTKQFLRNRMPIM